MTDQTLTVRADQVQVGDRIDWLGTVTENRERPHGLQRLDTGSLVDCPIAYLRADAPVTVTRPDPDAELVEAMARANREAWGAAWPEDGDVRERWLTAMRAALAAYREYQAAQPEPALATPHEYDSPKLGAPVPTEVEPEPPAPVGVGSVLDGNATSVAAELAALPAGAAAATRHGAVYQKRADGTWVASWVGGRTVGAGAPLTVIWLPGRGKDATMTPAERMDLRDLILTTLRAHNYDFGVSPLALGVSPLAPEMSAILATTLTEAGYRLTADPDLSDLHLLDGAEP